MNINEIKSAVENGKRVFWKQANYEVIKNKFGDWLVVCLQNENCTGLTHRNGVTWEYDEKDFYILKEEE